MRKGNQSRVMDGSDQKAHGNPNRFVHVVIRYTASIRQYAVIFSEDHNQRGSGFKERLVLIGADPGKCIQPRLWGTAIIELCLLLFRRDADLMFGLGIT